MNHVHQCFNAVGHGTFFNGLACGEGREDRFSWIYDCGSKRTTVIDQEIACLEGWRQWPEKVDLLVLSHFDDDHVNGVERLLRSRRVRVLALPYMDVGQSLACSASVGADPCSVSTALFQIDPVGWLTSRGLTGQVDAVLRIEGGPRGDGDPPVDGGPTPFPGGPVDDTRPRIDRADYDGKKGVGFSKAVGVTGKTSAPQMLVWKHASPMAAMGLPLELMFYNSTQHDLFRRDGTGALLARRSNRPIASVQADVDSVLRLYRLHDLSKLPRRMWRDALRAVYAKHFGNSSQQKNNISLCLLVRPLGSDVDDCSIFKDRGICRRSPGRSTHIRDRAGTLLLGDLRVDSATLAEMRAHFGSIRWADISTVQVPHHGSRHSWKPGAAAAFKPDRFIHCIPDASALHPHKTVDDDLHGFSVRRADYRAGVVLDYHFEG